MVKLRSYIDVRKQNHFAKWRSKLDPNIQARIDQAVLRLGDGNFSCVKPEKGGVAALRIDFGPGYRVYFGQDGNALILLLAGGTKKHQQKDIELAESLWLEYKKTKKGE